MCQYCDLTDYAGENLPFNNKIDGTKQYYEIYLLDDIESDEYCLFINGTHSEIKIKIDYCPMCGREL